MTATRSAITFALATVVFLEIAGLRAIDPGAAADTAAVVASLDGTAVAAPAAVAPRASPR